MSQLPSENTTSNNDTATSAANKTSRQKRERKQGVVKRRGRSITVEVVLSGDVRRWAQEQADENYRTLAGQIAYCVR